MKSTKCDANKMGIECKAKKSLSVGHCKWCKLDFCSSHRLPEVHNCTGMNDCKKAANDNNTKKLKQHACCSNKVISL